MINHIVLVKVNDASKRDYCIEEMRKLAQLDSAESVIVEPELGVSPNRWDFAIITQHKDEEQLVTFRDDETHKKLGGGIAQYVEAMASVDFGSDQVAIS